MGAAGILAALTGILIFFVPRSAVAQWPVFSAQAQSASETVLHDPSLDLLEAAVNPDPNPTKGDQPLTLSEGSALLASGGASESQEEEKKDEEVQKPAPKKPAAKPAAKKATPKIAKLSAASGYFGNPLPSGHKSQGIHGNNAVDLAGPCGSPIYAPAAGRVTKVESDGGYNSGWGNYVKIAHTNGMSTLSAHMSRVAVSGGSVAKGQVIGYVGNTGHSTGCHLHIEVSGGRNPF